MGEVFHEIIDVIINGLPVIFFLIVIGTFVFGGGLGELIDAISGWAIG